MNSVRVRMYRQGLGDCFLLTFTTDAQPVHLLIDCGVLKGTPESKERMLAVAENVRETTGGRLDVLVATHEHWDHLSGFLQAQEVFDKLRVARVWTAWTEDPEDELAKELGIRKAKALHALAGAQRRLHAAGSKNGKRVSMQLDALLGFNGELGAEGRPTTSKALEWVKSREPADLSFLRPGEEISGLPGMNGVRIYILGPPHDRRLIKRSDPSKKHPEVYELAGDMSADLGFMAAAEALDRGESPEEQPFEDWFRIGEQEASDHPFFLEHYSSDRDEWRRIEDDWLGVSARLALQLDSDTNNTSLVLAFELGDGGPVLLFPGDAQVGSWLSWEPLEWRITEGNVTKKVSAADLL
ncbi:MAG: hypothetical protein WD627_03355, partial [Actinomycetota bacterium]